MQNKKDTNNLVNKSEHLDLSKLFSVVVSSIKLSLFKLEDIHAVLTTINKSGLDAVKKFNFYNLAESSEQLGNFNKFNFDYKLAEILKEERMRLSILLDFNLPFAECDANLDFYQYDGNSCIAFQVGQGPFLESPEGPYIHDRMDVLKDRAQSIFCNSRCLVGIISTQDNMFSVNSIEEVMNNPPINWAFWSNEILKDIPDKLLNDMNKAAMKADILKDFGIFWKWSEFGEPIDANRIEYMTSLNKAISLLLKK